MKHWMVLFTAVVISLSLGTLASAAPQSVRPYRLEGKVVEVSKGWLEIEVTRVEQGTGIKAGAKLRINESSRTKFLQAGKPVASAKLAAGETVEVVGQVAQRGNTPRYRALTVTIVK